MRLSSSSRRSSLVIQQKGIISTAEFGPKSYDPWNGLSTTLFYEQEDQKNALNNAFLLNN